MTDEIRIGIEAEVKNCISAPASKEDNEKLKILLDALKEDDKIRADAIQQDKKSKVEERINNAKILADENITRMKIAADKENLDARIAADKQIAADKNANDMLIATNKNASDMSVAKLKMKSDLINGSISNGVGMIIKGAELAVGVAMFAGGLKYDQTNCIHDPFVKALGNRIAPKVMP